jgi:hypothetical protein
MMDEDGESAGTNHADPRSGHLFRSLRRAIFQAVQ